MRHTAHSIGDRDRSNGRRRDGRPTLALLSGPLNARLNSEKRRMWLGMVRVARQQNANLLYVAGGDFERAPEAILYDALDAQRVDGIVFFVSFAGSRATAARIRTFLNRYNPIPILNAGWIVPGLPTLSLDEEQGVRAVLDHVIDVHRCRRIAYVGRYPTRLGFEDRYQAFERILTRHGLFDPALVGTGVLDMVDQNDPPQDTLYRVSLPSTILSVFDERGLLPGRDYDAIVASGDIDAIQTIVELKERGIRVPEDIIVTGFRDGHEAPVAEPPLTTAHMPWKQAGMRAAELVLDAIAGHPLPAQSYVPMHLVIRQSCGCHDPLVTESAAGDPARSTSSASSDRKAILARMAQCLNDEPDERAREWASRLYAHFIGELDHERPVFLDELNQVLYEVTASGGDGGAMHSALSAMRRGLRLHLPAGQKDRAEDLWQQARMVIGQTQGRIQARNFYQSTHRMRALDDVGAALLTTIDLDTLLDILARNLPRLDIQRCYLALYETPSDPTGWARLLLAYDERGRIDLPPEGLRFPTRALVPAKVLSPDKDYALLVNALHVGDDQIGLFVCQTDLRADIHHDTVCETLRRQISSAIRGVQLRQEAVEAQARAEQSDQSKSRFLSAVSHELRTPLHLLVSLSEMAEQQFADVQRAAENGALGEVQHTIERLHNSALHLDHLILDVLDLARSQINQIELNRTPLDLRQLLIETAAIGESLAQQKALAWHLELDELPLVYGDRVRLRQVLLNLINNAVKFTAHGSISVRASAEENHVVVMVQDTGLGIPPADQDAIFDEFRQSQRSTARGHGGIGLGLAISKRLIELHQGTIGVYSSGEEGSGSTFYVRLPVAPSTHTDQPIPRQDRQQMILLSRDGAGNGQLDAHLAHNEIQTTALIFDQGGQWLERVIAMTPAAIVLDADLASQAGWTVVKALKEQPATAEIPVLFYALSEEKDRGSLLKVDYVSKDAAASQLTRALARHGLLSTAKSADPTILIVDDEPGLLEAYTSIVRMHLPHCRVRCAQDGAEALQIVCQTQPDLILLDLMMPTMDGFEVMEAIRHGETTRHIPIIVLTGQVLTENDLARLNQGSAAILGKGLFSAQETLSQIDAVLARNKCVSSETQWLVRRAMAYVHDHYAEPISGADIATYASVSQAHLIRCFNRELGITPVTYLNRWRIKQACAQLEASSDTVTEIAHASGFSSQSYFSRVFKDEMGTSPSAYRRALQQGSGAPMMWPE